MSVEYTNTAQYRQLKVEDALAYLEKVKTQFGDQPKIYNQFLDIMKNFKSHSIDTPGVIQLVSDLFRGHNELILGFNTFLPPGFKISVPEEHLEEQRLAAERDRARNQESTDATPHVHSHAIAPSTVQATTSMNQQQQLIQQQQQRGEVAKGSAGARAPNASNAQPQSEQPEFDTAINYVTKIKKRFSEETGTYKTFLEILHTYQKEQRNIKQVLDEVSHLFRDHPDLLKEFTYFLPDAVQDIAKTRLAAAAARSERRLQKQRREAKRSRDVSNNGASKTFQKRKRPRYGDAASNPNKGGPMEEDESVIIGAQERRFFERVKGSLRSRTLYNEFLSIFTLQQDGLISTKELLCLSADILGPTSILHLELCKLMASIIDLNVVEETEEDQLFNLPLSSIDFTSCRRCTPSYRSLPEKYPAVSCSERTSELNEILNNEWVSVPTGSEDGFTFKNLQRNYCEEAMFKCEDDRFEVDMVIEATHSTIRVLDPIIEEIKNFQKAQAASSSIFLYKLDRKLLNSIQLKAIARVYGDHGGEILELLTKNPTKAVPLIVKRLKQKCSEWINSRLGANSEWKSILTNNYLKSLDNKSLYFPINDKRNISVRNLINEIRSKAYPGVFYNPYERNKESIVLSEIVDKPLSTTGNPVDSHMSLTFPKREIHKDVVQIIKYACSKMIPGNPDRVRVDKLWNEFLIRFLSLPRSFYTGDGLTEEKTLARGTRVKTPYGAGSIVSFKGGYIPIYQVSLPWGKAFMRPKDIRAADGSDIFKGKGKEAVEIEDPEATAAADPKPRIAYLNSNMYLFVRLYKILYDRITKAKELSFDRNVYNESKMVIHPRDKAAGIQAAKRGESEDCYRHVLSAIYSLIDGNIELSLYESEIRRLLGNDGYMLGTVDRLIGHIVKQLTIFATDGVYLCEYFSSYEKSNNYDIYRSSVKTKLASVNGANSILFRIDVVPAVKDHVHTIALNFLGGATTESYTDE